MPVSSIKLLENLISFCSEKNKVISKNIANVGTENYRREDITFKSVLDENISAIKQTNSKHLSGTNPSGISYEHVTDNSNTFDSGINNVDIDREMFELAENSLQFKFASKKISSYYKGIQAVIKGGGAL